MLTNLKTTLTLIFILFTSASALANIPMPPVLGATNGPPELPPVLIEGLDPRLPAITDACESKIDNQGKTCSATDVVCVGPGEEFDLATGVSADWQVLQAAWDAASPGDAICMRGGVYDFENRPTFSLQTNVNGTSANRIYFGEYPGEAVVLDGAGDASTFNGSTTQMPIDDKRFLRFTADYWTISGFEIRYDNTCVGINGSNIQFVGNHVHNCWGPSGWGGITVGRGIGSDIHDNYIALNNVHHIRHGAGIILRSGGDNAKIIDTVIEFNLSYRNGFEPNGSQVPAIQGDTGSNTGRGGGNSDGVAYSKCNTNLRCISPQLRYNIVWRNADDNIDGSGIPGETPARWVGNISFDAGPEAGNSFKVIGSGLNGANYWGNLAVGGDLNDLNGSGVTANAFEIHHDSSSGHVWANNGAYNHQATAFLLSPQNSDFNSSVEIKNNVSAGNSGTREFSGQGGSDFTNNYDGDEAGTNNLIESGSLSGFVLQTTPPSNLSSYELWQYYYNQFYEYFKPAAGSPLIDGGTLVSGVHCPNPDDAGQDVTDRTCLHWKGNAPDQGPFER